MYNSMANRKLCCIKSTILPWKALLQLLKTESEFANTIGNIKGIILVHTYLYDDGFVLVTLCNIYVIVRIYEQNRKILEA